jgi:hypothetical protein
VPKRGALAVVLAAALLSSPGAGAATGKPLAFVTVTQGASQPTAAIEHNWGKAFALVMTSISDAYAFQTLLSKDEFETLQAVSFQTHFVIGVVVPEHTSGYSVTIKRITLQRISPSRRQFCIVARVDAPKQGKAIVQEGRLTEQTVKLSSRRFRIDEFHWAIPTRWVVRESRGKLLGASRAGGGYNGYGAKVTGKAAACRA